ncbi:DUF108 domain-containing protein [candidate division KSB3 bacterium]|uniref:DUF108 domain-containing protein n=1 Tax=candidate division KSB3 bacterium TaxID=2044937 RepID=A0A9D5Q527_9BACT|nr:DUF108 domain-containing protein [candidate division KSB3 bacterium]MBD3324150.1 DUF108 domain-containing protein [candidate division KSB3 bacterium]
MAIQRSIGLIGHGLIGSYIYERITSDPNSSLRIGFVYDQDPARTADLPPEIVLERVEDFPPKEVDMVCELAHPDVSKQYGVLFLQQTDYFVLSVTAMADAELEHTLRETALNAGTHVFIPHGGVMGLDAIIDGRDMWERVGIVMKKNPKNLDFARSGIDPSTIQQETLIYEGPTRGVCPKFPRNVNTHATLALGGIGFDRTHSTLIADPALNAAVMEIYAQGGGVDLELKRSEAITGVSGASTPWSVLQSILSTAPKAPGIQLC